MEQLLHSTERYRVLIRKFSDSPTLVIAFDNWRKNPDIETPCFGEIFLKSRRINHVTIKTGCNGWFQDTEFESIIAGIAAASGDSIRIGFGSSMGAFGALYYYEALQLHDALVLCPQFSINADDVPFELRWRDEAKSIVFQKRTMGMQAPISQATIIFDPFHRHDARHVDLIKASHPSIALFPVPFSGHDPAEYLRRAELLSAMASDYFLRGFESRSYRNKIRANRRTNGRYWLGLSSAAWPRRKQLAIRAAEAATRCKGAGMAETSHFERLKAAIDRGPQRASSPT